MEELIPLLRKIAKEKIPLLTPKYFKNTSAENVFNDFECIFKDENYIKAREQLYKYEKPKTPPSLGLLTSDFSSSVATNTNQTRKLQRFEDSGAPFCRGIDRITAISPIPQVTAIMTVVSTGFVNNFNRNHREGRRMPYFMCTANPMVVLQVQIVLQLDDELDFDTAWKQVLIGNLVLTFFSDISGGSNSDISEVSNYPIMAFLGAAFIFYSIFVAKVVPLRPENNIYYGINPQTAPTIQDDSSSSDEDEGVIIEGDVNFPVELVHKTNLKF